MSRIQLGACKAGLRRLFFLSFLFTRCLPDRVDVMFQGCGFVIWPVFVCFTTDRAGSQMCINNPICETPAEMKTLAAFYDGSKFSRFSGTTTGRTHLRFYLPQSASLKKCYGRFLGEIGRWRIFVFVVCPSGWVSFTSR